jgi:hypothetical protein
MSIATRTAHGNELSTSESGSLGRAQVSCAVSRPQVTAAATSDMSPFAWKMVVLTLLLGILFLGSLGAWVWYGAYLWRNIP